MKDEIEIGVKESNIWNPGGRRGVEIPEVQVGVTYKIISEVVACGYGIGWDILSIEKMQ